MRAAAIRDTAMIAQTRSWGSWLRIDGVTVFENGILELMLIRSIGTVMADAADNRARVYVQSGGKNL